MNNVFLNGENQENVDEGPVIIYELGGLGNFSGSWKKNSTLNGGERGGSVVECRTPEREVRGSRPTSAVLCPWARHFTPRKYWLITQEAMAPSRHDWKIVDWDVKPQHNQPTNPKWGGGGGSKFHLWIHRGEGHKYDFHFLFWHQNALISGGEAPQTPSPIIIFFSSFMPHFSPPHPKNENMKRYAYTEMPLVRFFCGSAHCHMQVQTFYKVYIVSNFSYTKGQFTTSPPHQKCHCSMSGNRKL